ncbi:MAG: hypothetical protein AAGE94_12410 [Acidobacteriota bacterium]
MFTPMVALAAGHTLLLPDSDPDGRRQYHGEPIDLSLRNAPVVEVLRSFSELGDFNLIVQPSVRGQVTVELKQVPWDQAMDLILRMHGLALDITQAEPDGRPIVRVAPVAELERMLRDERRRRP